MCPAEPLAPSDEQVIADTDGTLDRQYTIDALMSGRACRDALKRTCEWHNAHGARLDCRSPSFVRDGVL